LADLIGHARAYLPGIGKRTGPGGRERALPAAKERRQK